LVEDADFISVYLPVNIFPTVPRLVPLRFPSLADDLFAVTTKDHMVEGTGRMNAEFTGHGKTIPSNHQKQNLTPQTHPEQYAAIVFFAAL
jgi:hypothetical protein